MINPYNITVADVIGYLQTFDPTSPVVQFSSDTTDEDWQKEDVEIVCMDIVYAAMESILGSGTGRHWVRP